MSWANEETTNYYDMGGMMVQISGVGMASWDKWILVVSPLRAMSCAGSKGRGSESIILKNLDPVGG